MSDIDPAEVAVPASARVSEKFSQESSDVTPPPAVSKKPEREGLPPGYRMRADAHYVEHLTARRSEKSDRSESSRAPVDVPERNEGRERADRLFIQLAEDLATIDTAVAALASDASRTAKRVNLDLVKSQLWRASWALRARAIVEGQHRAQLKPRPLAFLLGQVRSGWAAECRLSNIKLQVEASDWNAVVSVDEPSLIAGLTGALVATLGIVGQADDATVTVRASALNGQLKTVDIAQDEVLVPPSEGGRFFDPSWTDRPGGWFAGLGAITARAVSQQHGGDAVFLAGETHGSIVRLQLGK